MGRGRTCSLANWSQVPLLPVDRCPPECPWLFERVFEYIGPCQGVMTREFLWLTQGGVAALIEQHDCLHETCKPEGSLEELRMEQKSSSASYCAASFNWCLSQALKPCYRSWRMSLHSCLELGSSICIGQAATTTSRSFRNGTTMLTFSAQAAV